MNKTLLIILLAFLSMQIVNAQTEGELTVSTATSETGGNYAPRNIVAIWVEDDAGNFVKTLLAYANNRKTHLNTWQATTTAAGSAYNTVDAITGATKTSHATRECSWNGEDFNGTLMADGNYKLWMELTDKNNTGNFSSIDFIKSETMQILSPDNVPSFSDITMVWQPSGTTAITAIDRDKIKVYPNPSTGIYKVDASNINYIEVRNINGALVFRSETSDIDITEHSKGTYLLIINTDQGSFIDKIIKE